ncbi:hypothetical protein VTP01DRAFT_7470 [Rhizomucor pusillus]|uniref:uncharacterized protein n=1 Tax=Rhizomucor pusillus TaxID=4840 RepID=UPI0037428B90
MTFQKTESNPSVVLCGIEQLKLENRPIPELGPLDVLINVKATGICGSDMHWYKHNRICQKTLKGPMVLGHESAGVVVAIGEQVTRVQPGDRVAIEPGVTCLSCEMCKEGAYNLCPNVKFCASPPNDGTLCHYYKHRQDCCFKLPDSVSLEEGALVEPLSVGIYSVERGNVKPGDRVFVFGAGPVGLLCAAAAKAAGACHIAVADISQSRLDFAKNYCTDSQILLERPKPGEPNIEYSRRTTEQILQQEGGIRPNCVFDCTGAETCVQMTVMLTRNGGSAVLVGLGAAVQSLPVSEIAMRQVDIKGIFRYCNT